MNFIYIFIYQILILFDLIKVIIDLINQINYNYYYLINNYQI